MGEEILNPFDSATSIVIKSPSLSHGLAPSPSSPFAMNVLLSIPPGPQLHFHTLSSGISYETASILGDSVWL